MPESPEAERRLLFREGTDALRKAGIECPALDVAVLLGHITGDAPETVMLEGDLPVSPYQLEQFQALISRRCEHVPVSRLIGRREFFSRQFYINDDVLDPRPETEILVEEAMRSLHGKGNDCAVLDVGTGSGIIAVTVASELPGARVTAIDISMDALDVARKNAVRHSVHGRVRFIQADLLSAVGEKVRFDVVLSNPPYISSSAFRDLPEEVRSGDPVLALVSGEEGTEFYPELARHSMSLLSDGGSLLVEVGAGQGDTVAEIFNRTGYADVAIVDDLAGIGRVVKGMRRDA